MEKILVVDDHRFTVEVIVDILQYEEKYDIYAFTRLPHLTFIKKLNPSIIILDAMLQKTNSLHLCKLLKETLQTQIIITSAYIDFSSLVYQSGADYFLRKPFDIDDLLKLVDICCKKKTQNY